MTSIKYANHPWVVKPVVNILCIFEIIKLLENKAEQYNRCENRT